MQQDVSEEKKTSDTFISPPRALINGPRLQEGWNIQSKILTKITLRGAPPLGTHFPGAFF